MVINSKQKIIVREESVTNPSYGCKPEERPMRQLLEYGVVNINKSQGPTSHQVADYVKKMLDVAKSGHGGTLDPNVTGVLLVTLAKATKVTGLLLRSTKEYVALMHIHKEVNKERVKEVMEKFKGEITQLPPRKSAVKRVKRKREIKELEILEIEDKNVLFRVKCQAGTYIRTLIHNIGQELGTGAHMAQLIRTQTGSFTYKTWSSLQDVKDAYEYCKEGNEAELRKIVLPFEMLLEKMPKIWIHDSAVSSICHGSSLGIPGVSMMTDDITPEGNVAIMTLKG